MRVHTVLGAIYLTFAVAAFAQGSGEIAYFHLNRVKPGMTVQYETTRKRHWLWHKRLGDTWSYQIWQIISGDRTGAFIISSFGHTWKEVDVSDQLVGGEEDPGASVDPYLASESESYYRYLPDLSLAPQIFSPAPMLSVTRFVGKTGRNHCLSGWPQEGKGRQSMTRLEVATPYEFGSGDRRCRLYDQLHSR